MRKNQLFAVALFYLGLQTVAEVDMVAQADGSPFAVEWLDYSPAPGQRVNDAAFNDPNKALGPPTGGGTVFPNQSSVVTLGGFGGSITLAFDHVVEDDPLNPFGMDAIVFGNSWLNGSFPERHWAECGTIEIALDADGNGIVDGDERWCLIPGSHISDPIGQQYAQTWDDDTFDSTYPPSLDTWLPPDRPGVWQTSGWLLPDDPFAAVEVINPNQSDGVEGIYGYADYAPTLKLGDLDADDVVDDTGITPELFYTVPDDPLTVGFSEGSGGGDAFDIAWAVDPATGAPAQLPGFNLMRITTAVNAIVGPFGEKSPEIDAVADVAPDLFGDADGDGDIDMADVAAYQRCFETESVDGPACDRLDRQGGSGIGLEVIAVFLARMTGPR